ncbi:TasA family protein [Evansella sp. AB-P1]|uniref:TasA family protein n=1 Tax=Evansella sp. AB-P1 TaxID=3037653 RepID=UPI00241FFF55|nr:TasA family protein [Evansella sp. AB-P1]MDG5787698.1 TasA family protein [Evansella sp. AB-P1]
MQNKIRLIFVLGSGLAVFLLFFLSVQYSKNTFADDEPISISTTPDSILFSVSNMKPGDWAQRELTIQNRGEQDFVYNMEVELTSGSEKLFNGLTLEINDANGLLFEGSLEEFNGIESRLLRTLHEEVLNMLVKFPSHLGNEYQGLEVEVEFLYFVEEFISDDSQDTQVGGGQYIPPIIIDSDTFEFDPDEENVILPSTATNSFNYLFIGIITFLTGVSFYLFHRRKKIFS